VLAQTEDKEEIIARVAALDIGKAELVCCVRLRLPAPRERRKRLQEVSTHSTMTASLTELANHLVELGVQRVVMEASSDYWNRCFTCWKPTDWSRGWSTRATSNTCRAGPKAT
jgi:transposase